MRLAYAGQYLKYYKPPFISFNSIINSLATKPTTHKPKAIITQEVKFPDASFYQKEINFDILKQYTKAIIIRAGQNLWTDEQFERNYYESKRVGLAVGVYWFYDGRISPGTQADILITLLKDKTLEMEVFIDWEKNYGGGHEGLQNVVAMMQKVEAAKLKIRDVGIYTGYYFFRANSNAITNANQYAYLKNKPLWLAWYTQNPSNVLIPAPWTYLTHWQFGTPVIQWGQQTAEFDMNFFNGSAQNFQSRYLSDVSQNGEPMARYYKLNTTAANIRSGPGASYSDLGDLPRDSVIEEIERIGSWSRYRVAQYSNGQFVQLASGALLSPENTKDCWSTNAYFSEVSGLPNPGSEPPPPPPPPPSEEYILHVKDGVTRKFVLSNE